MPFCLRFACKVFPQHPGEGKRRLGTVVGNRGEQGQTEIEFLDPQRQVDDIGLFHNAGTIGESQCDPGSAHGGGKISCNIIVFGIEPQAVGSECTPDQMSQNGILVAQDALVMGHFLHRDPERAIFCCPDTVHDGVVTGRNQNHLVTGRRTIRFRNDPEGQKPFTTGKNSSIIK